MVDSEGPGGGIACTRHALWEEILVLGRVRPESAERIGSRSAERIGSRSSFLGRSGRNPLSGVGVQAGIR